MPDSLSEQRTCPTCGCPVALATSDEGTSYFVRLVGPEVAEARAEGAREGAMHPSGLRTWEQHAEAQRIEGARAERERIVTLLEAMPTHAMGGKEDRLQPVVVTVKTLRHTIESLPAVEPEGTDDA